jgi:hypothetical protein
MTSAVLDGEFSMGFHLRCVKSRCQIGNLQLVSNWKCVALCSPLCCRYLLVLLGVSQVSGGRGGHDSDVLGKDVAIHGCRRLSFCRRVRKFLSSVDVERQQQDQRVSFMRTSQEFSS